MGVFAVFTSKIFPEVICAAANSHADYGLQRMTLGLKGTILFFQKTNRECPNKNHDQKPKRLLMSFLEFIADRKAKAKSPTYSVTKPTKTKARHNWIECRCIKENKIPA